MKSIGKIAFEFKGENQAFFQSLYANWEHFFIQHIEKTTDEVLTIFNIDNDELEIESIELDLGIISEENFMTHFGLFYQDKLIELLSKYINNTSFYKVKRVPKQQKIAEILFHFLRYGIIPSYIKDSYKNINYLFLEVVKTEGAALKKFLRTYGHYTSLQQRLVFQLDDTSLQEGVRLIAPGDSNFILSYISFLQAKYKQIERPVIKQSAHRLVVWEVVYTYLLSNKSSFFNKTSFLKYTVSTLAKRHNLSYRDLLKIIAGEIENIHKGRLIKSELYLILEQLKKDSPGDVLEGTFSNMARIYKAIVTTVQRNELQWKNNVKTLENILRREDTAGFFLHHLIEAEIIGLVKIIIPEDHSFVISYAKSLDRQKENGILQGKAGGEFRILKWQFIFPILIESKQSGFNRKYFVMRTLQRLAAHYNMTVHEVIDYFLSSEREVFLTDKDLISIFERLYQELSGQRHLSSATPFFNPDEQMILHYIRDGKIFLLEELKELKVKLENTAFREKILDQLYHENEHELFIRMLFPLQGMLISAYAHSLNQYSEKSLLEGKTGGRFKQLKWKFIHAALFEPQHQVFNKKYFVTRVLVRISAHYNLKTEELLTFLYKEILIPGHIFPFELVQVMKALYDEQLKKNGEKKITNKPTESTVEWSSEQHAKQRLTYYFGKEPGLNSLINALAGKHELISFIEQVLRSEFLLRNFFMNELGIIPDQKVILKIIYRLLVGNQTLTPLIIMVRVLLYYASLIPEKKKAMRFERQLKEFSLNNILIKSALQEMEEKPWSFEQQNQKNLESTRHSKAAEVVNTEKVMDYINNAGLAILHPYLPRLFARLSLTANGRFTDETAQFKALFLMQYAVFGQTEFPEHEMSLNKLLTGIATDQPIPRSVELSDFEMETVDSLLGAVIQNWSKLGNTSIDGLRGTFLIRDGKLEEQDDFYQLTVEEKAFDVLLGSLPWSISTIKYSWMKKAINVKWR